MKKLTDYINESLTSQIDEQIKELRQRGIANNEEDLYNAAIKCLEQIKLSKDTNIKKFFKTHDIKKVYIGKIRRKSYGNHSLMMSWDFEVEYEIEDLETSIKKLETSIKNIIDSDITVEIDIAVYSSFKMLRIVLYK